MNSDSRVTNSIKNFSFGFVAQMVQIILGFVGRTIFIKYLDVEYLGVNGLFTNVLSLLSLAELGVGSAMMYALYKPIADKDERKMAALIYLYGRIYLIIAGVITLCGLALLPFLNHLVKNPPANIVNNLNVIYLLFLFNTVSTYFFYYKLSLLHADQRSYIVSKANIVIFFLQNIVQIVVLIVFKNFVIYLLTQSIFQLAGNYVASLIVNKYYPFLKKYKNEKVDPSEKKKIYSNIRSTALLKIGGLAVNNTDNLILNYFSGLAMVGLLSNYILLIGLASGLIMQVFAGMTASIANVNATESEDKKEEVFNFINFANFWIYGLASILIVVLLNDFIQLWIGQKFILPLSVVIVLAFNFYIYGMQNAVWSFKITLGLFKQGQYLILLTAIINLALSFALGSYFGLLGILIATAIARLVTNSWYDPYILCKLALKQQPITYFVKYLKYLVLIAASIGLIIGIGNYLTLPLIVNMIIKVILCIIIPNVLIYVFYRNNTSYLSLTSMIKNLVFKAVGK